MRGLEGKVALVTGAASGIGRAIATRLVEEGCIVAGLDLAEPADTPVASFHQADVRDEAAVAAAVSAAVGRHGHLDIVANAAGVAGGGFAHMLDLDEWRRVIDVNLTGTFLVCKHALGPMVEQRSGSIVNIASIEGIEGVEGGSSYNASKGGVVVFTKNLAIDYGKIGIRVNCICPGGIDTPMLQSLPGDFRERFAAVHRMGRLGRPDEIAAAAAFLASAEASFVTGHALVVDGGFTAGRAFGIAEALGLA